MPSRPRRPCKQPGCKTPTSKVYCEKHRPKQDDKQRLTAHQRGYTYRYTKARAIFMRQHPWCNECKQAGRLVPSEELDHIVPHKGDPILFWDESNWQALCKSCHSSKTVREDGGFGRPIKTHPPG